MSASARRTVRATPAFFADLDRQLPAERGPAGLPPSRADFQAYDLLPIIERFATGFDDLPQPIPRRLDYRVLITNGRLTLSVSVTGQLAAAAPSNSSSSTSTPRALWADDTDDN